MQSDPFKPMFLIQIEGRSLSKDITQEITAFAFEDSESGLDQMELSITNRNLQFTDDPLFQEGNEIVARFGYVGNLSPAKKTVIKEIDYEFPDGGDPSIRIRAYDKGFKLTGKQIQKVWQKPAPGILYSEIAQEIARQHGLTPVVTPTLGRHLRVAQSNISDAQFLRELATKSRGETGDGKAGYVFFVQDDQLHFHPRELNQAPALSLEYFTSGRGLLRSFCPSVQSQGAKGEGTQVLTIGVDPRKKCCVKHTANNASAQGRASLGRRTYLVDGNTGETRYRAQESGAVEPSYERSEAFHEEPLCEPAQDTAEGRFKEAELRQVEAAAVTVGIPACKAKQNVEITGVGRKFSGLYYIISVRHEIGPNGYGCELRLRRNALGKGAGEKSQESQGQKNTQQTPRDPGPQPAAMVTIDAETGQQR